MDRREGLVERQGDAAEVADLGPLSSMRPVEDADGVGSPGRAETRDGRSRCLTVESIAALGYKRYGNVIFTMSQVNRAAPRPALLHGPFGSSCDIIIPNNALKLLRLIWKSGWTSA